VRDFLTSEIAELAVGTGTTDPKSNDTSLESEVISKAASAQNGGDGEVTHSMRLATTEANGTGSQDLTELGSKDGAGDLEDRITFAPVTKTNDYEIEFRLTQTVVNV
jgi:hypothetical protein